MTKGAAAILIGALLCSACGTAPASDRASSPPPQHPKDAAPSVIQVDAANLAQTFRADPIAARRQFQGRRTSVIGRIIGVDVTPPSYALRMNGRHGGGPIDAHVVDLQAYGSGGDRAVRRGDLVIVTCGRLVLERSQVRLADCDGLTVLDED